MELFNVTAEKIEGGEGHSFTVSMDGTIDIITMGVEVLLENLFENLSSGNGVKMPLADKIIILNDIHRNALIELLENEESEVE